MFVVSCFFPNTLLFRFTSICHTLLTCATMALTLSSPPPASAAWMSAWAVSDGLGVGVVIHNPIGILDAYSEQGEQVLGQPLLAAEGAIHVSDQGPGSQSACFSPMLPSSHAICHHEEHKRFWRRRGRWHDSLRDEERVFVWPVLASYAWILVCSNAQHKDGLSRISCVLYTHRRVYIHMLRGVSIVVL